MRGNRVVPKKLTLLCKPDKSLYCYYTLSIFSMTLTWVNYYNPSILQSSGTLPSSHARLHFFHTHSFSTTVLPIPQHITTYSEPTVINPSATSNLKFTHVHTTTCPTPTPLPNLVFITCLYTLSSTHTHQIMLLLCCLLYACNCCFSQESGYHGN